MKFRAHKDDHRREQRRLEINRMSLSVLIAGGGTGGHLYPGLAVARNLLARAPDAVVTFVGTSAGIEARVIPREKLSLALIRSAGLKGKTAAAVVRGLALLPLSAWDSWRVISKVKPTVVIGVGGYSSGPVLLLAALRGIPTLVMEQNAAPGLTNRLLARVVTAAAVTYPESAATFGSRAFVSGNPVRTEFFAGSGRQANDDPRGRVRILVFGGSQGAHAINVAMVEAAPALTRGDTPVEVTHQTGDSDLELVRDGYRRVDLAASVQPFIFDMHKEMTAADVVICRAGATTIAEVSAAGRAAILVPLPSATDDHQRKNAAAMVARNAAVMIEQRELSGGRLAQEILALARDPTRRQQLAEAAGAMARPDAARVIVDRVFALAG
jgi:UDP-N-acetylglucosamine--N-acetylmuramyl-(pentapeptide) pyrophosphoryl-undecaprenol N-acetylglucosamine transferase